MAKSVAERKASQRAREKAKRQGNLPQPGRQVFAMPARAVPETRKNIAELRALAGLNRADPVAADDVATLVVVDGEADPDGWCRLSVAALAAADDEVLDVRAASVQRCLADGRLEAEGPHAVRLVNPVRLTSAGHAFVYRRMTGLGS